MQRSILTLITLFVLTTAAQAADGPTTERGKELFGSASLGTNGRSCAVCHPDGKDLQDVGDNDDKTLAKITNKCIVKALKGKALADGSADMTSLIMYMKTVGGNKSK